MKKRLMIIFLCLISTGALASGVIVKANKIKDVKSFLSIEGIYKSRSKEALKVTIKPIGKQMDLFRPTDYEVSFSSIGKDNIFGQYIDLDDLDFLKVDKKGSISFSYYPGTCDYIPCIELESELVFKKKKNGGYYLAVLAEVEHGPDEDTMHTAIMMGAGDISLKDFKAIYSYTTEREYTGKKVDMNFIEDHSQEFEDFAVDEQTYCEENFEKLVGVVKSSIEGYDNYNCSFFIRDFLKKIR